MPRIRRWFHVSHDINSDPEVWELTDRFGDRAFRVWMEILSIGDRYAGYVPGDNHYLSSALAAKCKTKTKTVVAILNYANEKQWLVNDPDRRIRNHEKYKPIRDAKTAPLGGTTASPPPLPSPPHTKKTPQPPKGALNGFDRFWAVYPRKKSKGQAEKAWKALQANEQLQAGILMAVERAKTSAEWRKDGGKWIPYPATWLNAKGWEDEIRAEEGPNADLPEARSCNACGGIHSWKAGQRLEPCPQEAP